MSEIVTVLMAVVLALVISMGIWLDGYRVGYRQGQIDYHNGTIMYCLSVDDLAQTIWEKCNASP